MICRLLLALLLFFDPVSSFARVRGSSANAPITPFTGLIATRGKVDGIHSAPGSHIMVRTGHYARSTVTSLQAVLTNFYLSNTNVETGTGGAATVKASIEYPQGVCTAFTFSASSSGTIPDNGTLLTDALTISIPNGALFWVRQFLSDGFGYTFQSDNGVKQIDTAGVGDASVTVSPTDQTVACGTLTDSGTSGAHAPLAIIGATAAKSVCIVGDSIAYGSHDVYSGFSGDIGSIERSIGPSFAYSNISSGGDAATTFVGGSRTNRSLIFPYCTSAIVEYGRNDLYPSINHSAAQLESDLTTIYGYFTNPVNNAVFQTTTTPDTTSSDSWATTANQSTATTSGNETQRATFNSALRGASFGPSGGYFDINSAVGINTNFSFWNITVGGCTTPDGVHPSAACYAIIQSSGAIATGRIQ